MYFEKTGKLIDAWIRLQYMLDSPEEPITDYINNSLSKRSGLSGRQIERMRRCDGFPEDKSMTKLIKAIPDLESLNHSNFVERLLLPFSVVEKAQQRIKPPQQGEFNTIVIISGWMPPLGIDENKIAEATTMNISKRKFNYLFLYPNVQTFPAHKVLQNSGGMEKKSMADVEAETERWMQTFRQTCIGTYTSSVNKLAPQEFETRINDFKELVKQKISRTHISRLDNEFWFLLPSNYVVLYNPDKPKDSGFSRYGVFNVSGKSIDFPSTVLEEKNIDKTQFNSSEGWLYVDDERFEQLSKLYLDVIKDTDSSSMPRSS